MVDVKNVIREMFQKTYVIRDLNENRLVIRDRDPPFTTLSSVVSSCFICKLILKVHKISFFKEYTLVCLLWKSQI